MEKRVVITGMGTINPVGNSVPELLEAIKTGKNGIGPVTLFDTSRFPAKVGGEVKGFDPGDYMEKKDARKTARFTQYAQAGAVQAMKQAGLKEGDFDPHRAAVILGNGIGGFETIEAGYYALIQKGPDRVPPMTIPKMITNEGPANLAILNKFHGPTFTITTACASGTDAIGNAMMMVKSGMCDLALTGGTEGCISEMGLAGFCVLKALSTNYNDTPEKASRPFDRDRDGFVMGEGAGILLIESLEHAKNRGAKILAELVGYGQTCDAFHLTAPDETGEGSANAIRLALKMANLKAEDVDYINAHGTSTPTNDPIETLAIKKALGDHAYKTKVSSTKSMTGHLVGGAGGVEAIISVLAIQNQYFPPTINLENPDPSCDLDYVPNKGQYGKIDVVLSNSLGFGGHNGVLAIRKYTE
ncbi:MAG: beta-ketoacyl-ACP synthase II [Spirochaetales bacterium]|nr:beta-ketoacyl-ACP synthase II [Spirochaetales bacterium]